MTTPSALSSTMTDVQPSRSRAHFTFDIVLPPFRAFRARFVPISPTPPRVFLSQSVLTPHPSSAAEQQHELSYYRTCTFCRTWDHLSMNPYVVWTPGRALNHLLMQFYSYGHILCLLHQKKFLLRLHHNNQQFFSLTAKMVSVPLFQSSRAFEA